MPVKIAYVMSRFPGLSETFILREMNGMESLGWSLALYPLIVQREAVVHDEAEPWLERLHRMAWLDALSANAVVFAKNPLRYISIFWKVIRENMGSLGFLTRALILFPKAVWMALQMQSEKISHIHAHYATHPALVAWIIHQFAGISYSVTVHAHDIYINHTMLSTKLKNASFIAAISSYNRQYLMDLLGDWIGEKTFVVHCGIDPKQYSPRRNTGIVQRPFEILSIGSLRPYKGQKYLIDACALLQQRNIPFHCRIVGEGELYHVLNGQIAQLNLQDCVELTGPKTQQEVARLLSEVDCYVQPSVVMPSGRMEGIPVALMEAMACGLPVVASSISGIPELIQPEETGWLVQPSDVKALADSFLKIYADMDGAAQIGTSGRNWVLKEFDLRQNVSFLSDLFKKFIPTKPLIVERTNAPAEL